MATARKSKNTKSSGDSTAAMQERKRLRRGILLLAALLITVTLLVIAIWWMYRRLYSHNPRLTLQTVHVSSSGYWGQNDQTRAALVRDLKLNLGKDNVLSLNIQKLREDLKKFPNITDAQVRIVLPDTLSITIKERVPKAFLRTRGGDLVVDDNGWVMKSSQCFGVSENMPVIEVDKKIDKEIKLGMPLQAISEQLKIMAAVQNMNCFTIRSITPLRGGLMSVDMIYHGIKGEKKYLIKIPVGNYQQLLQQAQTAIETGTLASDKHSIITLSNNGMSVFSK